MQHEISRMQCVRLIFAVIMRGVCALT